MVENLLNVMAEVIRRQRYDLELTVGALAEKSNVDIGTISRTENGHTQLTLDTAVRLSRALELSLSDLAGDAVPWREQFASRELGILESDIAKLMSIYKYDSSSCEEMLSRWIGLIQTDIAESIRPGQKIAFSAIGLANFLGKHPLFRFSLRLPSGLTMAVLTEIQRLGGKLHDGDLQSVISALTLDPEIYRKLSRQDKDVLRRLQSSAPDRVRYSEVVALSRTLKVDLLGIFGNTVDLDMLPAYINDPTTELEMRYLITLFVIVAVWLRQVFPNDGEWLRIIQEDLAQRLSAIESQLGNLDTTSVVVERYWMSTESANPTGDAHPTTPEAKV